MSARAGGATTALTPLGVLVLGLVGERPMHPYEMFQTLLTRKEDRFAKLRPGSLYHTVDRLCSRKLLRINDVNRDGNRPERTVYAITDSGRDALGHALASMLRTPAAEYPALYLALAEAHTLGRDEVVALLDERLVVMRAEVAEVRTAMSDALELGYPEMFLLDAGCRRAVLDAQITWLEQLRTRLASGELMWLDEYMELRHTDPQTGHTVTPGRAPAEENEVVK
jgi:DNA-binding PadR family transcriptional regulator